VVSYYTGSQVDKQRKLLGVDRLDLVMIHSPLTGSNRRLETYEVLLNLQTKGAVRAVGVCRYGGSQTLQEIVNAGLPINTGCHLASPESVRLIDTRMYDSKIMGLYMAKHARICPIVCGLVESTVSSVV
jgi:predicted oxidoreductase